MRLELIHPMLVHFPIALLLTGVVLKVVGFFLRYRSCYRNLLITSWILLAIGVCFAWVTVLAGEIAAAIVEKDLCRPDILNKHTILAYTATGLFTVGLLFDWVKAWGKKQSLFQNSHKFLSGLVFLFFLGATLCILGVGFLGADMVYDQGAAVERNCSEESDEPAINNE